MKAAKFPVLTRFAIILMLVLVVVACSPTSPSYPPAKPNPPATSLEPLCQTAACFIDSAGDCEDSEVTLNQPGGIFKYQSKECTLKKTLVTLDPLESTEMKHALEGKSLGCTYQKGNFDPRWVNSLVLGLERCEGKLKDALAWLLMLA